MKRALPSIQTLRAFEAAGRHQSYTRAAEELRVTHGAISHRILDLQKLTGTALFQRNGNRMVPSEQGNLLLARVRYALQILEQAFDKPRRSPKSQLRLSVLPAFASHWLVARLGRFRAEHPGIEIDLQATADLVEVGGTIDLAIRYGPGGWPGVQSRRLAGETLFPVCSPEYRHRFAVDTPMDMGRCTLLRHPWQPWGPWLQRVALKIDEPSRGPSYSDAGLLLQAAAAGEGIALARGLLATDDLRAGRLVRLFDIDIDDAYAYFAVWKPLLKGRDVGAEAFMRWLAESMTTSLHVVDS
jgi:LysR family glycine cleavage system transcriptional activator